jgi:hypothetical protein
VVLCRKKASGIQIKMCFWAWNGQGSTENNKDYSQFKCLGKKGAGKTVYNEKMLGALMSTTCGIGWSYKAWVWAYAWGPQFWMDTSGQVSEAWKCEGDSSSIVVEGVEALTGK